MTVEVLLFTAEWCTACDPQHEILEEFDACPVEHIDVDADKERANEYSVRSVPTMVIERDGEVVRQFAGLTQLDALRDAVEMAKSE